MNIPGYDRWKLMTPEEDYEAHGGKICPWCGAYDIQHCEMVDDGDMEGSFQCLWEESEPDPDDLMEARREQREMDRDRPEEDY